jgi:hypothetical protein
MVVSKKLLQKMLSKLERTSGRRRILVTILAAAKYRGTDAIVAGADNN